MAPSNANAANSGWPSTTAIRQAPAAATAAPASPVNGGARCSAGAAGTATTGGEWASGRAGPRRTTRRHGSDSDGAMLPRARPASAAPPGDSPTPRNTMRLAPRWSDRPGSIGWSTAHSSPSIRAGTRPVSWVNVIAAPVVSRIPWWSSTVGSSMTRSHDGDRPTSCRPAGSARRARQPGPPITATSPTAASATGPERAGGAVVIAAPTRSPLARSGRSAGTATPSIHSPWRGSRPSASTSSAIGVGRCMRTHDGASIIDGQVARWDHTVQWAPSEPERKTIA